jgi:hypothetical protein
MDEILGALFAVVVGMVYLPQVTNAITTSRHAMTDVTTAQEQQQWATAVSNYVSQNMTTLTSTATAGTPVTLSVATVQAANVGLPTNFSGINPFNQTWTAQVLQPVSGTLQVLAFGSGGNAIKDPELGQIARAAAGSGGFIPTNSSGAYAGGPANAYGTYGAWKIATTGYAVGAGGAPATLLTFSNGTLSSNYLYRNAIPGQPQLNEMNTALGMNGNNISNAGQVSANTVVTAAGNGVQVGNSYYYGDSTNSAIRQNGALYIQNLAGSAAADLNAGNITSSGSVNAAGNVTAGGTVQGSTLYSTGNLQVNGSGQINGNANVSGNLSSSGTIVSNQQESVGSGCSPNGAMGNSGSGPLFCKNGVWSSSGGYNGSYSSGAASGSTGWIYNGSANAITVQAWGGNNPAAAGNNANPCALMASVNSVGAVANNVDNNDSDAKACTLSFIVPTGTSWEITSSPWEGNTGTFTYTVFTPS